MDVEKWKIYKSFDAPTGTSVGFNRPLHLSSWWWGSFRLRTRIFVVCCASAYLGSDSTEGCFVVGCCFGGLAPIDIRYSTVKLLVCDATYRHTNIGGGLTVVLVLLA